MQPNSPDEQPSPQPIATTNNITPQVIAPQVIQPSINATPSAPAPVSPYQAPTEQQNAQPPTTPLIHSPAPNGLYSTDPSQISNPTQPVQGGVVLAPQFTSGEISQSELPNKTGGPKPTVWKRKIFWILFLVISLLVGAAIAAYIFLWHIPNLPQNVWNTGLSRTGKQVDALITTISDPANIETLQKNEITVQGELKTGAETYTINVNSAYDPQNSNSTFKASGSGGEENFAITADIKTQLEANALFPNIYIRYSGVSSLGLDAFLPGVASLENTWIAIEDDVLAELLPTETASSTENLTNDEVVNIIKDAQVVVNEYIFTEDPTKAVLMMKQFIKTEKSKGITANQYEATINKTNAKAFCEALVEKLGSNPTIKRLSGLNDADYGAQAIKAKESCTEIAADIDDTEVYNIWMDKKYKLFHKIRFIDDFAEQNAFAQERKAQCLENAVDFPELTAQCSGFDEWVESGTKYTELGQVYKGESTFVVFINSITDTNLANDSLAMNATVNAESLTLAGDVAYTSKSNDQETTLTLQMASAPFSGTIDAAKPEGAITLQQALERIGLTEDIVSLEPLQEI